MRTELWREWSTRNTEQTELFKKAHPHLDFTPKNKAYPNGDYADSSIWPLKDKWCKEQDKLLIAERAKINLRVGDIVQFRSNWNSPDCNEIHRGQLAIVCRDLEYLGDPDNLGIGLVFLGEHMYYRTVTTEYLDRLQFLASEPDHVKLRAELKRVQIKDAEDDARRHQDWLKYEANKKQVKQEASDALSHISC